jgi:hypothetical protein
MSDCLHCDINELVQRYVEPVNADLGEVVAKLAESLVDTILLAPESDHSKLLADAISSLGLLFLEKSGAVETESGARH